MVVVVSAEVSTGEAEASAVATSAVEAVAACASAFRQDVSAGGFHTFPVEARASQAVWVCRE